MYWFNIISKNTSYISDLYKVFLILIFNLLFSICISEEPNILSIRNPNIEYIKIIISFPLKRTILTSYKAIPKLFLNFGFTVTFVYLETK